MKEASGDVESEVPSETVEEVIQPEIAQSDAIATPVEEEVVTQSESEVSVPSNPEPVESTEPEPEPERQVNPLLTNALIEPVPERRRRIGRGERCGSGKRGHRRGED